MPVVPSYFSWFGCELPFMPVSIEQYFLKTDRETRIIRGTGSNVYTIQVNNDENRTGINVLPGRSEGLHPDWIIRKMT